MDWPDPNAEFMVREILDDEFHQKDIKVSAYGRRGSVERCVWLQRGRERVPLIPLQGDYRSIEAKNPPRLSEALENWRTFSTGDLPQIISKALTELSRREKKL